MSRLSDRIMRYLIGVLFFLAVIAFAIAIMLPVMELTGPTQTPLPTLDVSDDSPQLLETRSHGVLPFDQQIYIGEV